MEQPFSFDEAQFFAITEARELQEMETTATNEVLEKLKKAIRVHCPGTSVQTEIEKETIRAERSLKKMLAQIEKELRIKLWCISVFFESKNFSFYNSGIDMDSSGGSVKVQIVRIKPQFFSTHWVFHAKCDSIEQFDSPRHTFSFDKEKKLICFEYDEIASSISMMLGNHRMCFVSDYFVKHIKPTNDEMHEKLWHISEECMRQSLDEILASNEIGYDIMCREKCCRKNCDNINVYHLTHFEH